MTNLAQALLYKYPGMQFSIGETYESFIWHDTSIEKPSEEELEQAWEEYLEYRETQTYKRLRAAEYPPLETQLDVMYNQGFDAWRKHIY
jgi:hypothetical protein